MRIVCSTSPVSRELVEVKGLEPLLTEPKSVVLAITPHLKTMPSISELPALPQIDPICFSQGASIRAHWRNTTGSTSRAGNADNAVFAAYTNPVSGQGNPLYPPATRDMENPGRRVGQSGIVCQKKKPGEPHRPGLNSVLNRK